MPDIYEIYAHIRTHWFLDGIPAGDGTRQFVRWTIEEMYEARFDISS